MIQCEKYGNQELCLSVSLVLSRFLFNIIITYEASVGVGISSS